MSVPVPTMVTSRRIGQHVFAQLMSASTRRVSRNGLEPLGIAPACRSANVA
jgi:hypothetical protein